MGPGHRRYPCRQPAVRVSGARQRSDRCHALRHPAFAHSIATLRACGEQILHEPERYPSPLIVPGEEILSALQQIVARR
jgi:hypothetical protein